MGSSRRIQAAAERRPLALVGTGVVIYAIGPVLIGGAEASGLVLAFWRMWCGTTILGVTSAVYVLAVRRRTGWRGWRWALGCGVVLALNQVCFISAVRMTSVVDVTLMQVLQPVVVALLAVRIFGERPGTAFRAWSGVTILGAAAVALSGSAGPTGDPLGIAFAVFTVLLYGVYFVGAKRARSDIDVIPFLFGTTLVAAVVVSMILLAAGDAPTSVGRRDLVAVVGLAVGPGAVGHFVSMWPLRWLSANIPPLLQLAIPFLSGFLAWLLLGEAITLIHLVGGAVTVVGAAGAILSPAGRRMIAREEATLVTGSG